jgi:hypothetical protein
MPSAARLAPRRNPGPAPFGVFDLSRPTAPPSADLVAAILSYADVEEDVGGGRQRRRVSPARLAELEARGLIDVPAERAAQVAVLWDEREGEIIRVLDDAPALAARRSERAWWESWWDEPRARLTIAARSEGVQ